MPPSPSSPDPDSEPAGLARECEALRARLAALEAAHEDLLSSLEDGVVLLDEAGRVRWMNHAAEELLGVSRSQVAGRALRDVLPPPAALAGLVARTLAAGRAHADYDLTVVRSDRAQRSVSAVASEIRTAQGEGRGVALVLRDLSRVRELEGRVRRADQLAAIGVLATGLAHEVRNPLVGIRAAAQLLQQEREFPATLAEFPQVIIREVDRLNRLVDDLLAFAGPASLRRTAGNVNQLVEDALRLQAVRIAAAGLETVREYDPEIPPVVADEDRLMQVFLNLIQNAVEATPAGGTLSVRTRFKRVAPQCGGRSAAVVEVVDSGAGMPAEVLAKVFTPFFTTKARGTGLGLSISLRIVEEHGGALEACSPAGGGALLRVLLPLAGPGREEPA